MEGCLASDEEWRITFCIIAGFEPSLIFLSSRSYNPDGSFA
jgi:hypothetical protein